MFRFRDVAKKHHQETVALRVLTHSRASAPRNLLGISSLQARNELVADLATQIVQLKDTMKTLDHSLPVAQQVAIEASSEQLSDAIVSRIAGRLLPDLFERLAQPLEDRLSNYIQRRGLFNIERSTRKFAKEMAAQLLGQLELPAMQAAFARATPEGRPAEAARPKEEMPRIPLDDVEAVIDFLARKNAGIE